MSPFRGGRGADVTGGPADEVGDALYMVDVLSNDEGHERSHAVIQEAGLKLDGNAHTQAELALEVFLTEPKT